MFQKIHLLFICNANINRSRAAAALFENSPYYEARSAGIYPVSLPGLITTPVSQKLIDWADKIFVMEETQRGFLKDNFTIEDKHLEMLNIPDTYQTSMAKSYEDLKHILQEKLADYLK